MQLTQSELINLLVSHKGNALVSFVTLSDARLLKRGNPFGVVLKRSEMVACVGANYQSAVNRQADREGNPDAGSFEADSLPWGEFVPGTDRKFIANKGETYVRMQFAPGMSAPKSVQYFRADNGEELTKEQIAEFLPKRSESDRQDEFGNDGKIAVRTFKVASLQSVTFGGQCYEMKS